MSKLLANQISNYNDNGPVEAKDGINVTSGKTIQVGGSNGSNGDYLKSTGAGLAWATFPTIPNAQVNADWDATSGVAQISNKPTSFASLATKLSDVTLTNPANNQVLKYNGSAWINAADTSGIALTDLSVTTASAGTAALAYNNTSGVLTYTPPDLSGYLTSQTSHADVVVDGDFGSQGLMKRGASAGSYSIVADNSANWNTAFGWGNHASGGYLTSKNITVTVSTAANGQASGVFYMDGVQNPPMHHIERGVTYVFDQANSSNETYNSSNHPLMFSTGDDGDHNSNGHYMTGVQYKLDGVNSTMAEYVAGFNAATARTVTWVVPTDAPDTIYYWCHHHTNQGNSISINNAWTATSHADVLVDGDFASQGLMKRNASAGSYSIVTDNSSNWDTAFGWGNHASQNYLNNNSGLNNLLDVNITSVQNNHILKYDSGTSKWKNVVDSGGGGGSTTFTGLTDTPANFTSQAGKYLKVNSGATALEYVDPIQNGDIDFGGHLHLPDNKELRLGDDNDLKIYHNGAANHFLTTTHTTYWDVPFFVLRKAGGDTIDYFATFGNNDGCKFYYQHGASSLKLSTTSGGIRIWNGGIQDKDGNLGSAGQVLSSTGTELDWVNASGGATVTTDDSAPGSPSDGDLWWKSDEGRLKVYYADGSSNQWVDASPPAEPPATLTALSDTPTNYTGAAGKYLKVNSAGNAVEFADSISGAMTGHLIPSVNAAYDFGSAEYKIRHLFLSDNTVYFQGDFLKVAQHNSGGSAQSASYLIPLAKLKDALNASANYEAFKTAILAITDA